MARSTKFIQRYGGKITAKKFLEIMVFNDDSLKEQSLNDLTVDFSEKFQTEIRKQSLDGKINENAVKFMIAIINVALNKELEEIEGMGCKTFNRILIKDSTSFQVDGSLKDVYPGSGGGGSEAGVRFQFEYDYLKGTILDLSLHPFNDQDAKNSAETLNSIRANDLIIRDLGYMNLRILNAIDAKGAFYVSRLNVSTKVYLKEGDQYKEVKFSELTKAMEKSGDHVMELDVYAGQRKQKNRLVIYLLPDQKYQERIRRYRLNNQKKGRGPIKKEIKARAQLNLFLTNTDGVQLAKEKIWPIYRLRWQIELIFKTWKSILKLAKIKKVKKERLDVYFYSKLLLAVIGFKLVNRVSLWMYRYDQKLISLQKSYKRIIKILIKQGLNLLLNAERLKETLYQFYNQAVENYLLESRKNEPSSFEIFQSLGI